MLTFCVTTLIAEFGLCEHNCRGKMGRLVLCVMLHFIVGMNMYL